MRPNRNHLSPCSGFFYPPSLPPITPEQFDARLLTHQQYRLRLSIRLLTTITIINTSSTCSLGPTGWQIDSITMHHTTPFALMSAAMASRSVILEAPDGACGYLNGMEQAPFGCQNASEKCAIYYPTSSVAVPTTLLPRITPAPQPSVICYEPSRGDCTVQPTACVDIFGDCTGTCSADPMTLKCTADSHLYCNRARFESPLSYRNIMAMDTGLRSTDAPADGWFCGPPLTSVQRVDALHSKTASMAHVRSSPISMTTTLGVTITLSKPGPGFGPPTSPPASPTTTLSVTITLSRPGQTSGLSPLPSSPAAIIPEGVEYENDTHSRDDYCLDEQDTAESCCDDIPWARQQRRQAADGSETVDSPVAASKDSVTRGSAIISTAYIGQTNRLPLAEATRPWTVVIPTAVETSTTTIASPMIPEILPFPLKGKGNQLPIKKVACGSIFGGLVLIGFVYLVWKQLERRSKSRRQQLSARHQHGHELAAHQGHMQGRPGGYLGYHKHIENFAKIVNRAIEMLGMAQTAPDPMNT